jgi:hypothetical protein
MPSGTRLRLDKRTTTRFATPIAAIVAMQVTIVKGGISIVNAGLQPFVFVPSPSPSPSPSPTRSKVVIVAGKKVGAALAVHCLVASVDPGRRLRPGL